MIHSRTPSESSMGCVVVGVRFKAILVYLVIVKHREGLRHVCSGLALGMEVGYISYRTIHILIEINRNLHMKWCLEFMTRLLLGTANAKLKQISKHSCIVEYRVGLI